MSLNARALALHGLGYGPRPVALQGLVPTDAAVQAPPAARTFTTTHDAPFPGWRPRHYQGPAIVLASAGGIASAEAVSRVTVGGAIGVAGMSRATVVPLPRVRRSVIAQDEDFLLWAA